MNGALFPLKNHQRDQIPILCFVLLPIRLNHLPCLGSSLCCCSQIVSHKIKSSKGVELLPRLIFTSSRHLLLLLTSLTSLSFQDICSHTLVFFRLTLFISHPPSPRLPPTPFRLCCRFHSLFLAPLLLHSFILTFLYVAPTSLPPSPSCLHSLLLSPPCFSQSAPCLFPHHLPLPPVSIHVLLRRQTVGNMEIVAVTGPGIRVCRRATSYMCFCVALVHGSGLELRTSCGC